MFSKTSAFYDAVYSFKDYKAESEKLAEVLRGRLGDGRHRVLDVACGTGAHIQHLKFDFDVEGLDLDTNLLQIAQERNPEIAFHEADMASFDLGKQFAAVVCLFSAIAYVQTVENLNKTFQTFARHTKPGGIVAIEPWFTPDKWMGGSLHSFTIDEPELKLTRTCLSPHMQPSRPADLVFHYLLGTPAGVEYFSETHVVGMFTDDDYRKAFEEAGFQVELLEPGLTGRGLYVGRR